MCIRDRVGGLKKDDEIEKVMITTNGSLLTKQKIISLKNNGLDSVTLSLDASSQKIGNIMNPINSNHALVSEAIDNVISVFN